MPPKSTSAKPRSRSKSAASPASTEPAPAPASDLPIPTEIPVNEYPLATPETIDKVRDDNVPSLSSKSKTKSKPKAKAVSKSKIADDDEPKRELPDDLTPKLLTKEQIETICASLPLVPGKGLSARKAAHADSLRLLTYKLSQVKLIPAVFDKFAETVYLDWVNNSVVPYTPAGLATSLSYSAPMTQSTLNSFHAAGAASGLSGSQAEGRGTFTAIKQNHPQRVFITPQSRIMPDPAEDMHYSKHISNSRTVYAEFRGFIEETTVMNLISTYTYTTVADPDFRSMYAEFKKTLPNFHDSGYDLVMRNILRINLDVARMFSHKILIGDVIKAMRQTAKNLGCTFVWGPTYAGTIFVLVYSRKQALADITGSTGSNELKTLNSFYDSISKSSVHVKGIPGITNMRTDLGMVKNVVRECVADKGNPRIQRVYINNTRTRESAVSMQDIAWVIKYRRVFTNADAVKAEQRLEYEEMASRMRAQGKTPDEYIEADIYEATDAEIKIARYAVVNHDVVAGLATDSRFLYEVYEQDRYIVRGPIHEIKRSDLYLVYVQNEDIVDTMIDSEAGCLIVETTVPNVDLMKRVQDPLNPDTMVLRLAVRGNFSPIMRQKSILLDYTRTYPDFHHSVNNLLGIQNCTIAMVTKNYRMITSNDGSINIALPELLYSYMSSQGELIPMNFDGLKRLNDPLTSASRSRAVETIALACLENKHVDVDRVSAAIYVGAVVKQGTGAVEVVHGDYTVAGLADNTFDFTFLETEAGENYAEVPIFDIPAGPEATVPEATALPDEQIKQYAGVSETFDPDFDLVF